MQVWQRVVWNILPVPEFGLNVWSYLPQRAYESAAPEGSECNDRDTRQLGGETTGK